MCVCVCVCVCVCIKEFFLTSCFLVFNDLLIWVRFSLSSRVHYNWSSVFKFDKVIGKHLMYIIGLVEMKNLNIKRKFKRSVARFVRNL